MGVGIGPKLPLVYDSTDGPYLLTKTLKGEMVQNFKNLLLTNPGEKMMDPDFGVGLQSYLFENAHPSLYEDIAEKIRSQTDKYMNAIEIVNIRFTDGAEWAPDMQTAADAHSLYIQVAFKILPREIVNVLTLPLFT